jgi:hypothetical protein
MWAASAAVLVFFLRNRGRENAWRAQIAPMIAFTLLSAVLAVTVIGFGELLQVSGNSPFQWLIPVAYFAVALIGVVWALIMRSTRPEAYAAIGRGTEGRVSNVTIDSLLAKGSHEPVGARAFHY